MKNIFSILIAFVLTFSAHSQAQAIIGNWQAFVDGDTVYMSFDKDGYVLLIMNNETFGGPSYEIDGVEASLTYELDASKTPYWIDFKITIKIDDSQYELMKGILEFSDDLTELRICLNFDEEIDRPQSFIEDDTLIMNRLE